MRSPHYIKLLLNDEVVRMCMEAVVAEYDVLSWNFLEVT